MSTITEPPKLAKNIPVILEPGNDLRTTRIYLPPCRLQEIEEKLQELQLDYCTDEYAYHWPFPFHWRLGDPWAIGIAFEFGTDTQLLQNLVDQWNS